MEKYLVHLENAISSVYQNNNEHFLDGYFNIEVDIKLLINGDDYWNSYYTKIEEIYNFSRINMTTTKDVELIKSFISSMYFILKNKTHNLEKLIPLIVFIDEKNILLEYFIRKKFYNELDLENAKNLLTNLSSTNNTNSVSSYNWEVNSYHEYTEGQKEVNIHKIYNFFETYERSRFTFNNELLSFYAFFLYKVELDKFVSVIDGKKDLILIVTLLAGFSLKDKLVVAQKSNDKLLKFEVIRQSVANNQIVLLSQESRQVSCLIFEISQNIDLYRQFLKYFLIYPTRTPKLSEPLALFLEQTTFSNIDGFLELIKFSPSPQEGAREFYMSVFNRLSKTRQIILGRKIFEKSLFRLNEYNEFLSALVMFELFDLVLYYAENYMPIEVLEKVLIGCLNDIKEIKNEWFANSMEQKNYFYKLMTKIFIYAFPLRKDKNSKILKDLQNFINTCSFIEFEHQPQKKSIKILFEEYIL